MAKHLKVLDGDYKITVSGVNGDIILSPSNEVLVNGNLKVIGTTSTINTVNTVIADNLIDINDGETGNGVTGPSGERYAGLRIARGSYGSVMWVFDETESWRDPRTGTTQYGAFVSKYVDGTLIGIKTNSIDTGGGDLALISAGTGVITVTGTNDYELQVTDDDHIPNKKYLDDFVIAYLSTNFQDKINENNTSVETIDYETSGTISEINLTVDGTEVASFRQNHIDLNELRISGTQIEAVNSNEDLILTAPGTGTVKVNDVLQLTKTTHADDPRVDPDAPTDGVKLYSKTESAGGTGIYFVNEDGTTDELVSKSKAILYGLLF